MSGPKDIYLKLKELGLIRNFPHSEYEPVKPVEIPELENLAETPELAAKHKKEHENWVDSLTLKNQQAYLEIFGD